MSETPLNCWHCGHALTGVPLPLGRREECPHCGSWLHVCHQCEFFLPGAGGECREPMANDIRDREGANYCDYFRPNHGLTAQSDPAAAAARARLQALFGGQDRAEVPASASQSGAAGNAPNEVDAARKKLEALFGQKK